MGHVTHYKVGQSNEMRQLLHDGVTLLQSEASITKLRDYYKAGQYIIQFYLSFHTSYMGDCQLHYLYEDYVALREKCPNTEFFWPVFSRIRTEYGKIRSLLIQSECGKIPARKNSVFGHFSHSVACSDNLFRIFSLSTSCGHSLTNWPYILIPVYFSLNSSCSWSRFYW